MQAAARVAAAIEILDEVFAGTPAEAVLTRWGRTHRFAGSKDRAAIRDHVFDALRQARSAARRGGAGEAWPPSGRAVLLGLLRAEGPSPDTVFTGAGHAPAPLSEHEREDPGADETVVDLPDWLVDRFRADLGPEADTVFRGLRDRAPVMLRVNTRKADRDEVGAALAEEGIAAGINPRAATALTCEGTPRGLLRTNAFEAGLFEPQDASSQAAVAALPCLRHTGSPRLLDFCAGGGGKALALAARYGVGVAAHDADPARMSDLPRRAARAGVEIRMLPDIREAGSDFDLVLCDAPCSGSGTWRRTPDAKWRFTPDDLDRLIDVQRTILAAARRHVASGGTLAYATCSVLAAENEDQTAWFSAAHPDWHCAQQNRWAMDGHGDGFFLAQFRRA